MIYGAFALVGIVVLALVVLVHRFVRRGRAPQGGAVAAELSYVVLRTRLEQVQHRTAKLYGNLIP